MKVLTRAKTSLVLRHPFWASLALPLRLEEDANHPTGYTDGTKIAYNPEYIAGLPEAAAVSFLAHEVAHLALLHHLRENGREHERFNRACDYAVNLLLKDSGLEIPGSWLCDEKYRDMSAERIYELLPAGGSAGGGCGPGEVKEYPGPKGQGQKSASDIREQEAKWRVRVAAAAQAAKAQGNLPGSLERLVKELTAGKVNWRAVLASYIGEEALDQDYSWKRPNTRYGSCGVILPALVEREGGEILVILDTSGSVSEADMAELAGEIQGIVASYDIELDVLYVDTEVEGHQRFRLGEPIKLEPAGGGGTDYRPGFEWAELNGITPCCAVYLTDGWCGRFPEKPPLFPVLWVLGGECPARKFAPPFGEVIRMDR